MPSLPMAHAASEGCQHAQDRLGRGRSYGGDSTAEEQHCSTQLAPLGSWWQVSLSHIPWDGPRLQPLPGSVQLQSLRGRVGGLCGTTGSVWAAGILGGLDRQQGLQDIGPQAVFPPPDTGPQCLPWFRRAAAVARPASQGRVHIHPPPGPWRQMSPGPGTRAGPSHLRVLGALTLWGQEGSQKASRKGCSLASMGWGCRHSGQGWGNPEEGAQGGSREREAGRAAPGACAGTGVASQKDCISHPKLRSDRATGAWLGNEGEVVRGA